MAQYFYNKDSKLDEKIYFLPACIISLVNSDNEEFAFGGEEDTKSRIRVIVLTSNEFILDGVVSRSRDMDAFIECSSKTGENVEETFEALTRLMLQKSDF